MKGLDEFLQLFGGITVGQIVTIVMALVFMCFIYKQVKKFFEAKIKEQNERIKAERERDARINEALEATRKYPEYRQQSIKIQQLLEGEIQELKAMQQKLEQRQKDETERLVQIEEENKRRECNRLREILLQQYRHYANKEVNPSQSWTRMESEAFWELFKDYEGLGGNGYMHTVVQPEMERLLIIEVG